MTWGCETVKSLSPPGRNPIKGDGTRCWNGGPHYNNAIDRLGSQVPGRQGPCECVSTASFAPTTTSTTYNTSYVRIRT